MKDISKLLAQTGATKTNEENQEKLSAFMKNQINKKNEAKKIQSKSKIVAKSASSNNSKKDGESTGEEVNNESGEMTEEEKLEEAKKESRKKSENYDQSKMLKKLLIETILKIVVGGSLIVAVIFAVVEFMPIITSFFSGFIIKLITGK